MIPQDEIERQEWLEAYWKKKLSQPEVEWLENAMGDDAMLAKEVQQIGKAMKTIQDAQVEQRMRDTLQLLRKKQPKPMPQPQPFWRYALLGGMAACVAFLLYLSFGSIQLPPTDYDLQVMRDTDPIQMDAVQKVAFDEFFAGQAGMAEGKYSEATQHFEQVLKATQIRPYFREAAEWHLVVSCFKSGQYVKAQKYLTQLEACDACEYEVSRVEMWKIKWQLYWRLLFQA